MIISETSSFLGVEIAMPVGVLVSVSGSKLDCLMGRGQPNVHKG